MPDITMCSGAGCSIKESCYRHLAEPNKFRQSWFAAPPFDKGTAVCIYYWEVSQK